MITKYENMWKEFAGLIHDAMPDNIIQIAIYEPQTEKGRLFVLVEDSTLPKLSVLSILFQKMIKKGLAVPLVVGRFFIDTSRDSFPLEFLNIQTAYMNVFVKEDKIKDMHFRKSDIRLQMEREVKSKVLLVRTAALENLEHMGNLHQLIQVSVHSFIPVLKGFHAVADKPIPDDFIELNKSCEELIHEDLSIFHRALKIGDERLSKEQIIDFFHEYTDKMMKLMYIIEKLPNVS